MKRLKPFRFPRRNPSRSALLNIYKTLRRHYGPRHWWPAETPFEVMVGAILTQNTTWKNVERAILNLKSKRALSVRALLVASKPSLAKLIRPAGYFNVKAERLKNLVKYFWRRYGGRLSGMSEKGASVLRSELLEVKGVGMETADSILLYALKKTVFVVDAYTRRVFSRHRYIQGDESYEEIQKMFVTLLPPNRQLFNDYHAQIVEVAKDFCRTTPQCSRCPLNKLL